MRNGTRALLSVLALAVLAAFPYGPLFAWSPVHPGYSTLRFTRADVIWPNGLPLDPAYRDIDRYVALAENFHGLSCPARIRVIACRNWGDCLRFAGLFLGKQRPLAITLATGKVIFVTPRTAGTLDPGGVLRHELSHATLNQNRSMLSVLRMLQQPWFSEGVAGVVAEQIAPPPGRKLLTLPPAEFLARAKQADLWPSFAAAPQPDWVFSYTAWTFFWERQIATRGKPGFLQFERACAAHPGACRAQFAATYGVSLPNAVASYQSDLRSGAYVPAEPGELPH